MKSIFFTVASVFLLLPSFSHAQLVSENYKVEGAAFNGNNTSQSGSSTNYTTAFEAGNLYILPESTTPLVGTTKYGTKIIVPGSATYTFLTPTLFGPSSAAVGSLVTLYIQVVRSDGVPLDPSTIEVMVTVQGANGGQPPVIYRGFGLYQTTYRVTKAGLDTVMATVNGIPVQQDVDGVSDGILRVRVAGASAATVMPPSVRVDDVPVVSDPVTPSSEDAVPAQQPVRTVAIPGGGESVPVPGEGLPHLPSGGYPLLILLVAIGALSGFLTILLAYSHIPFSYTEITTLISHGVRNVFGLVTWQKRRRPWGTVYDSVTKAPIDPAYVQLFTETGAVQDESITDLDGRYGFLVPDGTYTLDVHKTNYTFPSVYKPMSGQDVLYSNLYFGGIMEVNDTVVRDVPMDPEGHDWNQEEKLRTHQTHFFRSIDVWTIRILDVLFYLGVLALAIQFYFERTLVTSALFIGYLILLYLRVRGGKPVLYGVLSKNGLPLSFAIVRVLKGGYEISHKVADIYGRYAVLVSPGDYTVKIEERLGLDSYQIVYEHDVHAKAGIINMHLKL